MDLSELKQGGLKEAFDALESDNLSMPINRYPYESSLALFESDPSWRRWLTEKANHYMAGSLASWNRDVSRARRLIKVHAMRKKLPSWCNKSESNYLRHLSDRRKEVPPKDERLA